MHTARLTLRPLRPADANDLFASFADPETMRFMPTPPHENPEQTRRQLMADMALPGAFYWAICRHEDAPAIGIVYFLARHFWGQGLATEACRTALSFGFATLGYDRVELWIDETNAASLRVAARLGCRLKGRLALKYGHRPNHHIMLVYGIRAHEWQQAPTPEREACLFRAEPVLPVPESYPWGMREFVVRLPAGHTLIFGTQNSP